MLVSGDSWGCMDALSRAHTIPWICGEGFNLMLMESEKKGGDDFKIQEAKVLQRAVKVCQFFDLGYVGYDFTW